MQALELKIPPPIVMGLTGLAMWGVSMLLPSPSGNLAARAAAALILVAVGIAFSLAGVISFRRAKTTVNPLKPESTSSLVSSGIYRVTRNPMYVGMALVVLGWAIFLGSVWMMFGPLVFMLYISRFQIGPEEKVLASMFAQEFSAYKEKVRRWL